jgi:hypothetical protein
MRSLALAIAVIFSSCVVPQFAAAQSAGPEFALYMLVWINNKNPPQNLAPNVTKVGTFAAAKTNPINSICINAAQQWAGLGPDMKAITAVSPTQVSFVCVENQ